MKQTPLLHYSEFGTGPVVVLIHGYLASSVYWQKLSDELSHSYHVIAIDLLGFGHSPKPVTSRYDYEAQLASINRTLETLKIDQPFTLVGHSMGSLISLRYANVFPHKVRKLLLINTPVFSSRQQAKQEIIHTSLAYRIGLRPSTQWLAWPLFRMATRLRLLPTKVTADDPSRQAYLFQNTTSSRLKSMSNIIYAARAESDLRSLDIKTTLLAGMHDRAQYLQNLATLHLEQHIDLMVVDSGHHIPLTHPKLVSHCVRS